MALGGKTPSAVSLVGDHRHHPRVNRGHSSHLVDYYGHPYPIVHTQSIVPLADHRQIQYRRVRTENSAHLVEEYGRMHPKVQTEHSEEHSEGQFLKRHTEHTAHMVDHYEYRHGRIHHGNLGHMSDHRGHEYPKLHTEHSGHLFAHNGHFHHAGDDAKPYEVMATLFQMRRHKHRENHGHPCHHKYCEHEECNLPADVSTKSRVDL